MAFFESIWHAVLHAIEHTWPLVPFLYLTYLGMELLERRIDRVKKAMKGDKTLAGELALFERIYATLAFSISSTYLALSPHVLLIP